MFLRYLCNTKREWMGVNTSCQLDLIWCNTVKHKDAEWLCEGVSTLTKGIRPPLHWAVSPGDSPNADTHGKISTIPCCGTSY